MKTKQEIMALFNTGKANEYLVTFKDGSKATVIGETFEQAMEIWAKGVEYLDYTKDATLLKKFNDNMEKVLYYN